MMKHFIYIACMGLGVCACQQTKKFNVEGTIGGAKDKTLYLEASALDGVHTLDSLKMKEDGTYQLKADAPNMPEYYRLRIGNKVINFLVDSTETVKIDAPYKHFSTSYEITGDEHNQQIKALSQQLIALQAKIFKISQRVQDGKMMPGVAQDSLLNMINSCKQNLKEKYIFSQLDNPIAYYTLFQRVNGSFLFDPRVGDDVKAFAAVATSMQQKYPDADRTKNITNMALKAMREKRVLQQNNTPVELDQVAQTGIIDIQLRDLKGNIRKLSDLKGKVVLLDFTIYKGGNSTEHNFMLGDLYKKYADKGLQIYQVSLDDDVHFWRTVADQLPWICVNDPAGGYSTVARTYNVQSIPSLFLIDKNSELKQRFDNSKGLEQAVVKLL